MLSVLALAIVIFFADLKYETMIHYMDTRIMFKQLEFFYSSEDVMTDKLKFKVAFGLSNFDGSDEFIEDPDYVTFKPMYRSWGYQNYLTFINEKKTRRCTREDFGLDYYYPKEDMSQEEIPEPTFFEPYEANIQWFEDYSTKLWCIDDDIHVKGNYDSQEADTFAIMLERCNPAERSTCKSDEEIDEWIKGKFIVMVDNNWRFY